MAKVTRNILPAPLRPADFQNRELVVVRIKDVLVDVPTQQNRKGRATVLMFWGDDYQNKGLYLNATSIDNAIRGFQSDESDNWKDKDIPLIRTYSEMEDRETGRKTGHWVMWVAPADQWPALFKQAKQAAKAAKSAR